MSVCPMDISPSRFESPRFHADGNVPSGSKPYRSRTRVGVPTATCPPSLSPVMAGHGVVIVVSLMIDQSTAPAPTNDTSMTLVNPVPVRTSGSPATAPVSGSMLVNVRAGPLPLVHGTNGQVPVLYTLESAPSVSTVRLAGDWLPSSIPQTPGSVVKMSTVAPFGKCIVPR